MFHTERERSPRTGQSSSPQQSDITEGTSRNVTTDTIYLPSPFSLNTTQQVAMVRGLSASQTTFFSPQNINNHSAYHHWSLFTLINDQWSSQILGWCSMHRENIHLRLRQSDPYLCLYRDIGTNVNVTSLYCIESISNYIKYLLNLGIISFLDVDR